MTNRILVVDPLERQDVPQSLASEVRAHTPKHCRGGLRYVSLVQTRSEKGRTGIQEIYQSTFTTLLIAFKDPTPVKDADAFQVLLPVGPFTRCKVTAACTRLMG